VDDSGAVRLGVPFDIFKLGPGGSEHWIGESESFTGAMFQAELTATKSPSRYLIRKRDTGEREIFNLEEERWRRER